MPPSVRVKPRRRSESASWPMTVYGGRRTSVDDRPADVTVAADIDAVEEDRVIDHRVAVHRTRGERMLRWTCPPETMQPVQRCCRGLAAAAWPGGPSTLRTNFGGGFCGWKVGSASWRRRVQDRVDGDEVHVAWK